jgi:hypothetical protein
MQLTLVTLYRSAVEAVLWKVWWRLASLHLHTGYKGCGFAAECRAMQICIHRYECS